MNRSVRIIYQTTLLLLLNGICVKAQPTLITEVPKASTDFFAIGDLVYFTSNDSLFRTDGTAEGTIFLKNGVTKPWRVREFKGMLFFTQKHTGFPDPGWMELWRSDGTPAGTFRLKASANFDVQMDAELNGQLYFGASEHSTGRELYRTDGTVGGTRLVRDIFPGAGDGYIGQGTTVENSVLFAGNDGVHGNELWMTDGTAAGTQLVKDINPGSGHGFVTPETAAAGQFSGAGRTFSYGDKLYFIGLTSSHGEEPWVSDGTTSGTTLLSDIVPGSGSPETTSYKIAHDGTLYFMAYHYEDAYGAPSELWRTGGSPATTSRVKVLDTYSYEDTDHFLIYHDKLYFFNWPQGVESYLWTSDGTEEGTQRIAELMTHEGGIWFFEVVNDHILYFGNHQNYHTCFYRSDGTSAGTSMFTCFNSTGYAMGPRDVTKVGELVFYADHIAPAYEGRPDDPSDYYHLFQSDGFTAQSMSTLFGIPTVGTDNIVNFRKQVVFTTSDNYRNRNAPKYLWIYDPSSSPMPGAGSIEAEVWTDVDGRDPSTIPVDEPPASVTEINIFETPSNIGDNYGSRVRGYIAPPVSGQYTFWIASDDQGELWLSSDENPINKVKIAEVEGWTNPREWNKYPSQRSASINLVAGQKYYIEALLKEGTGRDHLAVGWRLPGGSEEMPIPGSRLIPFNIPPEVIITSPANGHSFSAPADIIIRADASDHDGSVAKVEFYNGTAKLGEDTTSPYSIQWTDIAQGNYKVIAKAIDDRGGYHRDTISISVMGTTACAGAGMIRQEFWTNVPGTRVSSIPTDTEPDFTRDLTIFEGPATSMADNYGSRIRGYICPPVSGQYTFWIAGDDQVELWLSTD